MHPSPLTPSDTGCSIVYSVHSYIHHVVTDDDPKYVKVGR